MKTLDNKKVFVSTPETSKAVQEKAFKLGYRWTLGEMHSVYAQNPFLYFNPDNTIGHGRDFEFFRGSKFEEITAAEILAMEVPEPEETFEVFQKVLVRDNDNGEWEPDFYAVKREYGHRVISGSSWKQCIDYETNKHLAFTTDKP